MKRRDAQSKGHSQQTDRVIGAVCCGLLAISAIACTNPAIVASGDAAVRRDTAVADAAPDSSTILDAAAADTGPTVEQQEQLAALRRFIDDVVSSSGWWEPSSADAIYEECSAILLRGDGADADYVKALRHALLAVPQGHQYMYSDACGADGIGTAETSDYGVCAAKSGDDFVVTFARAGNALGLSVGDSVFSLNALRGEALLEEAIARPRCASSAPSDGYRTWDAAGSFFSALPVGGTLGVRATDGAERSVVIPAPRTTDAIDCGDALGRSLWFNASSYLRSDGTAVIRVPRFFPTEGTTRKLSEAELVRTMTEAILTEFDKHRSAPRMIWDVRGNGGGVTPIALAIVAGMPGVTSTNISYCQYRLPGSMPPEFDAEHYAEYAVDPDGGFSLEGEELIAPHAFAYAGRVAVLIDGGCYSATDYFAYAAKKTSGAILVGSGTAGAYGGSSESLDLKDPLAFYYAVDVNKCSDADTNAPLEGHSVQPDISVEYSPTDLATGVDTVLEAAAAALLVTEEE